MKSVTLDAQDEGKAWLLFPGSPVQIILHNDLSKRLEQSRTALETVGQGGLAKLQGEIHGYRNLLAFIHSKDGKEIKEIYVEH
jgi:hypothetical protein